jgi:hypothetical protein
VVFFRSAQEARIRARDALPAGADLDDLTG